jgi:hypothetical protein
MTNKQPYANLLDNLLDEIEPDYSSLGLKTPKAIGDQFRAITADESDSDFLDEISGHSRHTNSAGGRTAAYTPRQLNSDKEADNDSVLSEVTQNLTKAENTDYTKKALTDKDIQMRIKTLLNLGYTPEKVAGYLNKLGALKVLDTSQSSSEFIQAYAPGLGIAYIEPNFYMNACDQSLKKIEKEGKLRAIAVKKIAACQGCSCNHQGSCSLYKRPIVASAAEMTTMVQNELAKKGIKSASLKEGLAKLHDGVGERKNAPAITASANNGVVRTAGDKGNRTRKEASVAEIGAAISSGVPLAKVFKSATAQYGKVSASSAIKRYIAGLKESKAKVVLSALDCSFLKGKLASTNAIVGESKCASCSYRGGMHCGLTGGTLLSFPGMKNASSNKISHGSEVDGRDMLFEYDILDTQEDVPLTIDEDRTDTEVELNTTSKIDIE